MKSLKWILVVLLVLSIMLVGCAKKESKATEGKKLKVGFVYVGPIGDAGWTYAHNQGRLALEKQPFIEKTTYVESVPEGAEASRVITQLAEAGNDIIFTTSFGYMDPTAEVAKKYPDKIFMHCSGYKRDANMGTYFGRMYQAEYLAGMVAGKMSKKNKLGYVAPHPIPEVIRHLNGFALGVRAVNPKATVQVVWVNSWFDPAKEMDAANALIDMGCDIIAQGTDSAAPQQAAEKKGIYCIGYDSDMRSFAPKANLTGPIWHWDVMYNKICEEVSKKTWKSEDLWWGIESGLIGLAPYNDAVPQDVRTLVDAKQKEMTELKFDVFAGPIKDQKGVVKVQAGKTPTDPELLSMDWFVEGVVGELPKAKK